MKQCKWCEAKIEDDVKICPYCRAEQSSITNHKTNHVEKFLEKHPNGVVSNNKSKSQGDENLLFQIANDIRIIRNIIIIFSILSLLGSFITAINILGW